MEDILELLQKETKELIIAIKSIDRHKSDRGLLFEQLIKQDSNLKVRIYKEDHHQLPHIHIDIGNNYHTASIAIDNQTILSGSIENKYKESVQSWIKKNKELLLKVWNNIQQGQEFDLTALNYTK